MGERQWYPGRATQTPLRRRQVYTHRDSGNPNDAVVICKAFFDALYEESKNGPPFWPFQIHPYSSSRPGRAKALKEMIQYMQKHEGVWFARGSEIAELTLKLGKTARKAHLKEAVGFSRPELDTSTTLI